MGSSGSPIDLSFRPREYFWPPSLKRRILSSIKGAARKEIVRRYLEDGRVTEVPSELLQPSLSNALRDAIGAVDPQLMGGEYLPDQEDNEEEIARITIDSTTRDVTSVYARRGDGKISYRVVDEYGGETLVGPAELESTEPLTLEELTEFFLDAWDLLSILDMNFGERGYDPDDVLGFFDGSSDLYPEFRRLIRERVEAWLKRKNPAWAANR